MARPLRIEYPGALYHVTSRGNERKDIFKSQRDREHSPIWTQRWCGMARLCIPGA